MNAAVETLKDRDAHAAPTLAGRLRQLLCGRRAVIVLALVVGAGLFFNWEWLAAVGVAPLLIALAPCAAMCALGLCMSRMGNKSCSAKAPSDTKPYSH